MTDETGSRPDGRKSWVVAGVGAVAMVFTFGTPLSYGILTGPVAESIGVSPVALSPVFSVMLATFFVGSGIVGVFATRLPARLILAGCALATAAVAPSLSLTSSYLAVAFAVLGLALGTVFVLVASIVPRWFEDRRGTATGLIFVGNGLGLFLLPPTWQFAIAEFGVERGFLAITGLSAVAFGVTALVCRRPRWASRSTATLGDLLGWVWGLAGTRSFRLLFVGIGLAFAWYQLLAAYAVDLFAARGLTEAAASAAFGLVGGVSIVSRIGGGYVADVVGSRRAFLTSLACVAVGVAVLLAPGLAAIALGVFLIGIGLGGCATLYIPLLMGIYDPEMDSGVVGVFNVAAGVGALAMPPLGTATIAYTDGYVVAVALTVVVTVAAFWLVVAGTRPT